jgi:hypothetical protein
MHLAAGQDHRALARVRVWLHHGLIFRHGGLDAGDGMRGFLRYGIYVVPEGGFHDGGRGMAGLGQRGRAGDGASGGPGPARRGGGADPHAAQIRLSRHGQTAVFPRPWHGYRMLHEAAELLRHPPAGNDPEAGGAPHRPLHRHRAIRARRCARRSRRGHGGRARPVPRPALRGRTGPPPQGAPLGPAGGAADAMGLSLRDGGVPLSPDPDRAPGR